MVGFRLGDVGAPARRVVLGLVQRLLRGSIAARQIRGAGELLLCICEARFRLGDLGRQRGGLLRADAGIDVVAVGLRGGKGRARLDDCRAQLERRKFGDHVTGMDAVALVDLDGRELAADLGRNADFGCAHDADDRRRRSRTPEKISADARRNQEDAERDDACGPAASHAPASA